MKCIIEPITYMEVESTDCNCNNCEGILYGKG